LRLSAAFFGSCRPEGRIEREMRELGLVPFALYSVVTADWNDNFSQIPGVQAV
jgi:hypothetical protein